MPGKNSRSERKQINRESRIHGPRWQTLHGGYFSDPSVSAPFIEAIQKAILDSAPQVIVDLGGGTGFILRELLKRSINPGIRLINLDLSGKQLNEATDDRIISIRRSMTEFRRGDAGQETSRYLFIMRSALHYLGRDSIMPLLNHLRLQTKKGEFFVHQTACFDSIKDARSLNKLYEHMATNKWYSTTKHLCRFLEKTGWSITSVLPAPALPLTSSELGERYGLSANGIAEIRDDMLKRFGEKTNVFALTPRGFKAYLHYRIFSCVAR